MEIPYEIIENLHEARVPHSLIPFLIIPNQIEFTPITIGTKVLEQKDESSLMKSLE
jgi:hypothetical protein